MHAKSLQYICYVLLTGKQIKKYKVHLKNTNMATIEEITDADFRPYYLLVIAKKNPKMLMQKCTSIRVQLRYLNRTFDRRILNVNKHMHNFEKIVSNPAAENFTIVFLIFFFFHLHDLSEYFL